MYMLRDLHAEAAASGTARFDWHHAQTARPPLTPCTSCSCRGTYDPSFLKPHAAAELDKIRSNAASVQDTLKYLVENFDGCKDDLKLLYKDAAAVSEHCLAGPGLLTQLISSISMARHSLTSYSIDNIICKSCLLPQLEKLYSSCHFWRAHPD